MRTSTLVPARVTVATARTGRDRAARLLLSCSTSAAITLPEDIAGTSGVVLEDVVTQATNALTSLSALDNPSGDDVEEGKRLVSVITAGRKELDARRNAAGQRKGAIGDLLAGVTPEQPAEGLEEGVEAAATTATAAAAPAPTPVAETIVAAATPVIPSPRAGDVAAAGGGVEAPEVTRKRISLVAAPDSPSVAQGHVYGDFLAAAEGVLARTSSYPTGAVPGGSRIQNGALRLQREFAPGLVASAFDADEAIEYAVSLDRVGGADALLANSGFVAAGGWASPSETLYDLVELEATDGMFDLPEVQIVRGGVRYTRGPEFSTFRGKGFKQSETQAIAGQAKSFYRIPVADFVEERAGVTGLGVTAGILQSKAYPELTARVLRGLLVAHAHEVNADTLTAVAAGSTAVTVSGGAGAFVRLLSAIELQAIDTRLKHSMDENEVLEVALPTYALGILRQDLAYQNGWNARRIPDSAIIEHFTDRRVRVQWVKDWQDSTLGQATPATAWPATVKFLIYPAGTWVRGLGEVISVDTLYDAAGLGNNDYTALFTEEAFLVTKRGHESRVVTVPVVADGSTTAVNRTDAIETANP